MEKSLTPSSLPALAKPWLLMLLVLLIVAAIAWGIWGRTDPYTQAVLAREGDASNGAAIYRANCAVCHGLEADGNIGPSLWGVPTRKSKSHLIEQVTSGKTPPMPQFQPNPQEMADLLQYLESL